VPPVHYNLQMTDKANAAGVAFVTGAGSGIGRATALRLAARGDAVGIFDLSEPGAAETTSLIRDAGGQACVAVGDVASAGDLARAVAQLTERHGPLTTAVANAGIEMIGTVLDTSEQRWDRAISVMLTGAFLTARATLPGLLAQRGSFVAVASDAGVAGFQNWAPYVAAKHGVVGLARAMALDYGPHGVRVNVVCPGPSLTPMNDRVLEGVAPERAAEYAAQVPLGRHAEPEAVADVIAHLTSEEARHTNGLVYMVDGGSGAGHFDPREVPPLS
jgi:meso-butanediol dehydrogenase / (S,S)-butanediol dehydrogenase / diacetyl reductase